MWVTEDGTVHTVALPSPDDVLGSRGRACWAALDQIATRDAISATLDAVEVEFFELDIPSDVNDEWVAATPPIGVFDSEFVDVGALGGALRRVEPRWRLDVVQALGDLNDERSDR